MTILEEDLNYIVSLEQVNWSELQDKRVLVTGSTGLVGQFIVRALDAVVRAKNFKIEILAHGRSEERMKKLFSQCENIRYIVQDICIPLDLNESIDFIFHCAAITDSQSMKERPVDVINTSFLGTKNILELAREKSAQSMVYLSSMEVYGDLGAEAQVVTEDKLGFIDVCDTRSCYPQSKRLCENLSYCYSTQYGVSVKVARLAQTFGAGISPRDNRVFAQFARNAMNGEDIVLHTEGNTTGNYCYLADVVCGLFVLLLKGKSGEIYNVSNQKNSMTVREMADVVAEQNGVNVIIDTTKNKGGYAKQSNNKLDIKKIEALGWKPRYKLAEMYERMMTDWRENAKIS